MFTRRDKWNICLMIAYMSFAVIFTIVPILSLIIIDSVSMLSLIILAAPSVTIAWIPMCRVGTETFLKEKPPTVIKYIFWRLWEGRLPEFVRVMYEYFAYKPYKHYRKIELLEFLPIGWRYAEMGLDARMKKRL